MSILVVNAGSTSLKYGLFDARAQESLATGVIDWADGNRAAATQTLQWQGVPAIRSTVSVPDDDLVARCALDSLARVKPVAWVGHRVVHGGTEFQTSRRIDPAVKTAIGRLAELAPLHNPPALKAILAVEKALPDTPQVAVFDSAFFASLPPRAFLYPVPFEWHARWGARRFGFHGLSNAYCANRALELIEGRFPRNRLVTCHLGGGCSATAVANGIPVQTTMGFSPLEGLMMGTRSGSVDPGLLIHLQRRGDLSLAELDFALNYRSGLFGVSGLSSDLSVLEAAASQGHERAQLAFDMFADRVRSAVGALSVGMGGIDALIFTDRIGEQSAALRAAVCRGLECLGLQLDPQRNAANQPDSDIATPGSPARILIIRTREDLMIARETLRVGERG